MYIKEMLTEEVVHVKQEKLVKLINENQKLTRKKESASKLIADLKKKNHDLESTILLMEENVNSIKNHFTKSLDYYKEHMGDDMMSTLAENQRLKVSLIELRKAHRDLQQKI